MAIAEVLGRRNAEISGRHESDFRMEYGENVPDQALIDDVISYLGEYRFNLPKFTYTLKFSDGKLKDPHRGNPMQDLAQRAIGKKVSEGNFYPREKAEKQGLINLDSQLRLAREGDTIVWASPPGPKAEGYGDYGFIFIGNVGINQLSEKVIRMTAIRVEKPEIGQFNKAIYLLTAEKTDYKNAEEFLANPKVLKKHLEEGYVDAILGMSFSFKPNVEAQRKFEFIIREMFPLISDFIRSAKDPWKIKSEKIKELFALENYALQLKKEYEQQSVGRETISVYYKPIPRLPDIVGRYGYKPPQVAGSCPVNNNNKTSFTSSNMLSRGSFLNGLLGEQEWFHCPECDYQADGPIGDTCPGCGLTKNEYAKESGAEVCD